MIGYFLHKVRKWNEQVKKESKGSSETKYNQ